MTDAELGIPERAALLALMTYVESASNTQLRERYGFTIERKVRDRLTGDGLITFTKGARNAITHTLTDQGWARCRDDLATPLPGRQDRGYRILHGVLQRLDEYLAVHGLTLADFLEPEAKPDMEPDMEPHHGEPADGLVRAAYDQLASRPGAWVGLAALREALPGTSREDFDDAVLQLDLLPHVSLIPEVNQKALTLADRAAAIHVGGEDKHLLQIRPT